jgi:hypothetical protein
MTRILGRMALAALLAGSLAGCLLVRDQHGNTHLILLDGPEPVGHVEQVECRHHDSCGHYWYNGSWYAHRGHRHGHGCGHYYHGGRWVLAGAINVGHGHSCGHHCNHYHHNGQWYAIRNHRHGQGCGHSLRSGVWVGVGF